MIFPIPSVTGNNAASRRHQIRFFHPAVSQALSRNKRRRHFCVPGSAFHHDIRPIRRAPADPSQRQNPGQVRCFRQPLRRTALHSMLLQSKKAAPARAQLPDRADPDGNIQNSRMINPACVQHIPDAFYHGGNVSVPTFVQHLAYYQTAAWRNSGIQTVGAFSVSAQAACHMGSMPAVVIRLLLSADKVCKPCDSPGRDPGCSAIPVSSTAAVTPFPESPFTSAAVAWTTLFTLFKAYASFFF